MDYWNFSEPFTFRPLSQDEKSSDFQPHVWAATHFKGIWLTEWDPEDDEQIGILWRAAENNGYVSNCVQKRRRGFLERWSWCRLFVAKQTNPSP